ncbi:uncharacterized protein LOC106373568 [Brassica napus]|uniref:uncharacterized protein LOC106373568 n=1 Tax=Brassica napus TaxID=3708 RepID=UPI0006AAF00B|nr:uncharacterized protein LOC106373568 [Brassica napus]
MVFVEGSKRSIEGALTVFDEFAKWSGLNISIEKSMVYMAGVAQGERSIILMNFPFAEGALPVRLPSKCIKEVEQLCASFLWSGPELKSKGAKVAWKDVCKLKAEGELGIRALKEVNVVNGLKLIWRMLTGGIFIREMVKKQSTQEKEFLGSECKYSGGFLEVEENVEA